MNKSILSRLVTDWFWRKRVLMNLGIVWNCLSGLRLKAFISVLGDENRIRSFLKTLNSVTEPARIVCYGSRLDALSPGGVIGCPTARCKDHRLRTLRCRRFGSLRCHSERNYSGP